jgi:hypothetical protein
MRDPPICTATDERTSGRRRVRTGGVSIDDFGPEGNGVKGIGLTSSAVTLGEIEKLGWRLENASYLFMITGETSTSRVFVTGEATAISGVTVGIYLFRNTALPESAG